MKLSIKSVIISGIAVKFLVFSGILLASIFNVSAAEANPIVRKKVNVYNPETGNSGRATTIHNSETGARYGRVGGYNAETGTYQRKSGAYNPSTGQGYKTNTEYLRGQGSNTQIDTMNNGSYSCSSSREAGASCAK